MHFHLQISIFGILLKDFYTRKSSTCDLMKKAFHEFPQLFLAFSYNSSDENSEEKKTIYKFIP